jgi:hypothetical protein
MEWNTATVGLLVSVIFNFFMAVFAGLAWWHSQKADDRAAAAAKRNLIKERDDLLDVALDGELTCIDLAAHIFVTVNMFEHLLKPDETELSVGQLKKIAKIQEEIAEYQEELKSSETTVEQLNKISNPLREHRTRLLDMRKNFLEVFNPESLLKRNSSD